MKRVYIAGPYNAENICTCLDNMRRGMLATIEVLKLGYAPFCPWVDYHYRLMDGGITREMYQAQSMAWLRAADAVLVLPGWAKSEGTQAEIAEAVKLKIPVYYSIEDLVDNLERV